MFNTEMYMYTQFWHRYTNMETSADFRQPCFNKNFQTTNIKSNQNFPLHKYTGWLNLASHIWLNPLKFISPQKFLTSWDFCNLLCWNCEQLSTACSVSERLQAACCQSGESHRNKKRLLMIPVLISNQCLPSLLIPLLPLLCALVNKMLHPGNPVPVPTELWCPGQWTDVTGIFSSSMWRQHLKFSSLNYFSELLPCKAALFVHQGLGALGKEVFLKWG